MKTLLPLGVLLVLVLGGSPLLAQDAASEPEPQPTPQKGEYVEVLKRLDGEPLLVVNYPWSRLTGVSVEARGLAEDEVDSTVVFPLFFASKHDKGDVGVALDRTRLGAENVPTEAAFALDDADFRVLGNRNALGKPSIVVACETTAVEPSGEKRVSPRAIFPRLEPWSTDPRTLFLELPPEEFAGPATVRVWLLRGAKIVWWQNVAWPGYPGGEEEEPAGE
jgi:hypothetical protein